MRDTTWGAVSTLCYGKALSGYQGASSGPVRVFGTNGPVGYTTRSLSNGPGVIVGRKGAYRGVHFSEGPFWVIDTAYYLEPGPELDIRWAYYALQDVDINGLGSGSAIPSTTRDDFYSLPVRLPSEAIQGAVAEVLRALDDKIAANEGVVARATELSLALVASRRPSIPLSEVVTLRKRTLTPEAFGPNNVTHFSFPAYDDGKLPVMTDPAEIKSAKVAIDSPAVLVSKLNPRFPRIWDLPVVPPDGPALASTEFLVLDSDHASSSLLWAILSQPSFSQELQGKTAGTSGSHQRVRPDALLATDVIDPRLVSERAHATVTSLGRTIHIRRQESRSLANVRDTLLPQLMSGKIRVKDAERAASEVV